MVLVVHNDQHEAHHDQFRVHDDRISRVELNIHHIKWKVQANIV